MAKPLISVLLPVYNEKTEYLAKSIESVLDQSFRDFELLIIDDGSTLAGCLEMIDDYAEKDSRIRVIKNPINIGLTKTLNKGLQLSQGEFIARQDSDDISFAERLEKQLNFMQNNPDYALCGSWAQIIDEKGENIGQQRGPTSYSQIKKSIILANYFIHSSWFFRKSIILSIGGYSEEMLKAQDYDLLLKLATRFPLANIPEYLCCYRMSDKSISFKNNKNQERYALKIRLKALQEYGYAGWNYLKLVRPLFFYFLIPSCIKKFLMKLLWRI